MIEFMENRKWVNWLHQFTKRLLHFQHVGLNSTFFEDSRILRKQFFAGAAAWRQCQFLRCCALETLLTLQALLSFHKTAASKNEWSFWLSPTLRNKAKHRWTRWWTIFSDFSMRSERCRSFGINLCSSSCRGQWFDSNREHIPHCMTNWQSSFSNSMVYSDLKELKWGESAMMTNYPRFWLSVMTSGIRLNLLIWAIPLSAYYA